MKKGYTTCVNFEVAGDIPISETVVGDYNVLDLQDNVLLAMSVN